MGTGRSRARRKRPSEKQKPFFDKQTTEHSKFFSANSVQRKLSVGKSNDPAEKEADNAAQKVTQVQKAEKKEEEKPVQKADKKEEEKPVQKADKKEEEKPVQKADKKEDEKVSKKEDDKPVQRAAMVEEGEHEDTAKPSFENLLMSRKGMGFEMPDDVRKDMEMKFRTSFKEVRIHTDKEANEMCEGIHALAFAHGYDIYFNEGMYNPDALTGRELLAHELAHVVQQNG